MLTDYDAILIVSFGGPEGPDDIMPFLENVTRGRNIPRERLIEVAHHYEAFGGVSPINQQTRDLIAALHRELAEHGPRLPIYWGNRNWHPLLPDTLRRMRDDGIRRAIAFVVAAFSSYSSCRQYRENIEAARATVGADAPTVDKLRVFYNHPGYIDPMIENTRAAIAKLPADAKSKMKLLFTAHSIPTAMADSCRYAAQLLEASRLVADGASVTDWKLVYQSRSGPPTQPWLEPDVCDELRSIAAKGETTGVVLVPIGFLSDHVEVLYDLDHEAADVCRAAGLPMVRAATAGCHPRFVQMIRELIVERMTGNAERPALGRDEASHDVCPVDCCPAPVRPTPR